MNTMHFGIYTNSSNVDILFYATNGFFASRAWRESDEQYHQILGQKFGAYTADDGKEYNLGRSNIRRISSEEELNSMLESACPAFKVIVECLENHHTQGIRNYIDAQEFLELVPFAFQQKDHSYTVEEMVQYYEETYCQKEQTEVEQCQ